MFESAAPAWYAHGYAVWSGGALAGIGGWMLLRGARAWPGAWWRRVRGVAYVPGELSRVHGWLLAGCAMGILGAGSLAVEWGLRAFQSYDHPVLAGRLDLQAGSGGWTASWSDAAGRSSQSWPPACPRLTLEGEFVEWSRLARAAGFRNRHRVVAGALACADPDAPAPSGSPARLRPPSQAWEILRRWDRYLPMLRTARYRSPALKVRSGSWRVFVMPDGYVFSE